jgi:hypothetical protein
MLICRAWLTFLDNKIHPSCRIFTYPTFFYSRGGKRYICWYLDCNEPLFQSQMTDKKNSLLRVIRIWKKHKLAVRENVPQCQLVHNNSQMSWPWVEPETNRLNYSLNFQLHLLISLPKYKLRNIRNILEDGPCVLCWGGQRKEPRALRNKMTLLYS